MTEGFGLASVKQEGMCSGFDHPEIKPWKSYAEEFSEYLEYQEKNFKWYLRPLMGILRKNAKLAWDHALLTNAIKEKAND